MSQCQIPHIDNQRPHLELEGANDRKTVGQDRDAGEEQVGGKWVVAAGVVVVVDILLLLHERLERGHRTRQKDKDHDGIKDDHSRAHVAEHPQIVVAELVVGKLDAFVLSFVAVLHVLRSSYHDDDDELDSQSISEMLRC